MKAKKRFWAMSLLLTMVLVTALFGTVSVAMAQDERSEESVDNYDIVGVYQSGASEVTVTVQAHYCTACNPNAAGNPGCTPFDHGYPGAPPYSDTTYWCSGPVDGRYVAVQVRDGAGNLIGGPVKVVLTPANWALCSIIQMDIAVTLSAPLTPGDTVVVEADLYCSFCGHYYPAPEELTVQSPPAPVPGMTEWGIMATVAILGASMVLVLRRRQAHQRA